jgi:glucan-binding YG repeat protein
MDFIQEKEKMQYEFLKKFPRRMKNVGLYAVIIQNSSQKLSWKQYGFTKFDEQINLLFEVLLYIMEQSLKEEKCTMDDIATYIDTINVQYLRKDISYEQCHQLGDFIVNTVLSNEGRPMYFGGYDFEKNEYEEMHISYVANKIVYVENEVRRTSYYLTDDGYNLLLSTLEIEDNMKFNIHEIIFRLHLEKQSYDKAVNDIKNVFNLMRIQFQRVQEAMRQIRRNALSYSVDEYEEVLVGNLNTITDTKKKFQEYKTVIQERVKDLEEENINIRKLSKKEQQDLNNLRVIEEYLTRVLDEHQKILNSHFDLKILYTEELERLSQARLIQRFSMRRDLYDKVLKQADTLKNMDMFLRSLFNRNPEKIYNLNKAFSYEKSVNAGMEKDTEEEVDFDEEAFRREKEEKLQKKLLVYEKSLQYLLEKASVTGEVSLGQLKDRLDIYPEEKEIFIPNVDVFKEIMVELIRNRTIDIATLKKERREYIQEQPDGFQLNEMILKLVEEQPENNDITSIEVERLENEEAITFSEIKDEENRRKTIRCSNVLIRIFRK